MKLYQILLVLAVCLIFSTSETSAQCGADGTQPCPKTPKKTTPKKNPPTKPTVTNKTNTTTRAQTSVQKSSDKFVSQLPIIEMILIPPGSFMQRDLSYIADHKYVKTSVDYSFYIGKYEVTQDQWKAVTGKNPSYFSSCGGNCPVEQISWDDAKGFIRILNTLQNEFEYYLPTRKEWEYAAGKHMVNCDQDKVAWFKDNSNNQTHPVGQKQANEFGLYDVIGNVSEWVEDSQQGYTNNQKMERGESFRHARDFVCDGRISYYDKNKSLQAIGFRLGARAK